MAPGTSMITNPIFPDELRAGGVCAHRFSMSERDPANHMGFGYGTYSLRILVAPNTGASHPRFPDLFKLFPWINDKWRLPPMAKSTGCRYVYTPVDATNRCV